MQSHIIRAPLARIMGLAALINQNKDVKPDKEVMDYLHISLNELDQLISNIVNDSNEMVPGTYQIDEKE